MSHKWQNIDKDTVGWHRCEICGDRHHFPNNELIEPKWLTSCEERQKLVVASLADSVTSLLHKADSDTATIRKLLAAAIAQHEVDSPYTRSRGSDQKTKKEVKAVY